MHIHFTLHLFSKGSEGREPQPCHPLTATVVMVTIWEASVVGSVRTLDISHPKQK